MWGLITRGFVSDTDADSSSECTFWLYWNEDWRVAQRVHPSEPSWGWIRHLAYADIFQFQSETKRNERPECAVQYSHVSHVARKTVYRMLKWLWNKTECLIKFLNGEEECFLSNCWISLITDPQQTHGGRASPCTSVLFETTPNKQK